MSKINRLIATLVAGAALVGLTGCSGINSSQSVSPASFLIPGLIMNDPRPAVDDPFCGTTREVARLMAPLD
jgi:hypothetical protein